MMDPHRRLADTTVVRLESERDALKRENRRYRAFVAAFDAVVPHTFAGGGRFVAVTLADWERIVTARAALDAAPDDDGGTV